MNLKIPEHLKSLYPKLPYHNLSHTESFDWANCPSTEAYWAAIFHDIVYDPMRKDNEEMSIKKMQQYLSEIEMTTPMGVICTGDGVNIDQVKKLILSTKDHVKNYDPTDHDMVWLHKNDLACFRANANIFQNEMNIFKEFQFIHFKEYKEKRQIVLSYYHKHPLVSQLLVERIIAFLDIWQPSIGLFVGSFDPFHRGHYDILQQAEKVYDKVIVAQGQNEDKETHKYSLDDVPVLKYYEKMEYRGSLTDLVNRLHTVYPKLGIVRGLRNYHDLHDESGLFNFVKDYTDVPFSYFISKSENLHISSGAIRKLEKLGQNIQNYLP